jgi:hypothetical protein
VSLDALPFLDELAVDPGRAAGLPRETAVALLASCAVVQGALIARLLSMPATARTADGDQAEDRLLDVDEAAERIAYYAPQDGRAVEHREPGGRTEVEARRLLRRRQRELAVHTAGLRLFQGPRQERVTLEDLLKALEEDLEVRGRCSIRQVKSHLKPVRAFFREVRALAVTPDRLRDYVRARQDAGSAPATLNRQLELIRRAFTLAAEAGTVTYVPRMPRLPERNARQGFFERADLEAVLTHLTDADVRDCVEWFSWTGMRPREIRVLTWPALDG